MPAWSSAAWRNLAYAWLVYVAPETVSMFALCAFSASLARIGAADDEIRPERPPLGCVSRNRPWIPPPAVRRQRLHPRPDRRRLLGRALPRDHRASPDLPGRPAGLAVGSAPIARFQHRRRGTRCLFHLYVRARPGPARCPLRAVLRVAFPHPRRLVACPPVLHLVSTKRVVAPDHGQGTRRLDRGPPGRPHRDPGFPSKGRTEC